MLASKYGCFSVDWLNSEVIQIVRLDDNPTVAIMQVPGKQLIENVRTFDV